MLVDNRIKPPFQCTDKELEAFYQLLVSGGEVEERGLKDRVRRAKLLAFHYENQTLAGIAAIKFPTEKHKRDIFLKSKTSEDPKKYSLELGYAVTLEEYQGRHICSILAEELIRSFQDQNIYATTKTTKIPMQKILEHQGFKKTGEPYAGKIRNTRREGYLLQLFVRTANVRISLIKH
ncbi:hypothetical protein MUO79_11055 [Candidatus Bathyarchaeota archaeon]|nr:hypothetical protein [Candidatus Bathyarchaeota archaeon]